MMNRISTDPKVKKTLVRNSNLKIRPVSALKKCAVYDTAGSSKSVSVKTSRTSQKENELSQPTLCSSEALAHYIDDAKKSQPVLPLNEDLNLDKGLSSAKMTKKLNFHINDKIYKNLIELNAIIDLKARKDKRPSAYGGNIKKDVEPNIEDFYEDCREIDSPPPVPIIKTKFKPIKKVENGDLHKLLARFEDL